MAFIYQPCYLMNNALVSLLCVCGLKGLSPSVKNTPDNQKSASGPHQDTEGDTSIVKTGTGVIAELALMDFLSENVVWGCIWALAEAGGIVQIPLPHLCLYTLILESSILIHLCQCLFKQSTAHVN